MASKEFTSHRIPGIALSSASLAALQHAQDKLSGPGSESDSAVRKKLESELLKDLKPFTTENGHEHDAKVEKILRKYVLQAVSQRQG